MRRLRWLRMRRLDVKRRHRGDFKRSHTAVAELELPPAVFKTCPWQPREIIETGLRQWLRCCAAALRDGQVIGMPSHAVDEAWHGLILCTARYRDFCDTADGKFMDHHPVGGAPAHIEANADPMDEQLRRTVVAWSLVGIRVRNASCGPSTSASVSSVPGVSIRPVLRRSRRPCPNSS